MRLRLRTDRLAELLAASRLSQNHWAIKLGLSRGHWSDIVNGRHPFPSAKTRDRMLETFGVPLESLFAAEDERGDDLAFRIAIAPRYEIMQELGQGAMGTVFLAADRTLGSPMDMELTNITRFSRASRFMMWFFECGWWYHQSSPAKQMMERSLSMPAKRGV